MMALAHERAERLVEPDEVLAGIVKGRQRVLGGSQRRGLREKWLQAMKAGDSATAAELQQEMLNSKRRERPRPGVLGADAEVTTAQKRPPPSFGIAAKAQQTQEQAERDARSTAAATRQRPAPQTMESGPVETMAATAPAAKESASQGPAHEQAPAPKQPPMPEQPAMDEQDCLLDPGLPPESDFAHEAENGA